MANILERVANLESEIRNLELELRLISALVTVIESRVSTPAAVIKHYRNGRLIVPKQKKPKVKPGFKRVRATSND